MTSDAIMLKIGGFALKSVGVQRIDRDDISSTLTYVSNLANIPKEDLHLIGSGGKVATSGDIDLAIDSVKYNSINIHNKMKSLLGEDRAMYNKGTRVASYAIPINGDERNGLVQVDFMYSPNIDWAKFAYYSAGDNSEYKGAVRTILIAAVATLLCDPTTDYVMYDLDRSLLARSGWTFDLSCGLRRIFQYRPTRKDHKGWVKNMKSVSCDEFEKLFTQSPHNDLQTMDNPQQVTTLLFGDNIKPSDISTAESVLSIIKQDYDKKTQQTIFERASVRAKPLYNKMKWPPEIIEHITNKNKCTNLPDSIVEDNLISFIT
jgi:hypothetical protein